MLIIENKIYIANVGDSRAIMSLENGKKYRSLTIDQEENIRDINKLKVINNESEFDKYFDEPNIIYRIYPCHLAVSRSIGDIKAKDTSFGGIHDEIISTPDIYIIDISSNIDFIIMGCDGIYDNLSNFDIIDSAWFTINHVAKERKYDINLISLDICNMIIKNAMDKLSSDNLSVIVITFEGLEKYLANMKSKESKDKVLALNGDGKKK